jgi:hypothetical protein
VSVEHFSLAAGTDIGPLLQRLTGALCGPPHWGYVIEGGLFVTYGDDSTDTLESGDVFHVSVGQSMRVEQDCELFMFSPQRTHLELVVPVQMRMSKYRH